MNNELQEIIQSSTFEVVPGSYVYAQVSTVGDERKHFLVARDADEITVVTTEDNLAEMDLIGRNKDNYALIGLRVSVPFYSVGFLALVSQKIAEAGMNILIVSTYSKDYIMVRQDLLQQTKQVLLGIGFTEYIK